MSNNIDLSKYLNPSEDIVDAISKLEVFYQLTHQKEMEAYSSKGKDKRFSGTLGEYIRLREVKELMSFEGKPWNCLLKAIFLLGNYTSKVDVKSIDKLSATDVEQFISFLKNGVSSHNIIKKWIEPLSKKEGVIEAIHDASKVDIGHQFKILQLAKLKNYNKKKKIFLFEDILDIENPEALIYYLQHTKDEISDCLIVATQRNKKYDFRGVFFLFLVYNGYLYSIDNSSNRLNLDNTEGMRNPSRYLERAYENVWLPIDLLFEQDIKRKIIVKGQKVFKIYTWKKIAKNNIGYIYWLNLFLFRVVDYVSTTKILKGLTSRQSIPLLESKNKTVDFTYNTREWHGNNEYLLNKYKKEITSNALVLKKEELPLIIATKEHIQNIIAYKKRNIVADEIEKAVFKDFDENKLKVKAWIKRFLKKQDAEQIVIKALKDLEYPCMHYPRFTEERKIKISKKKILSLPEYLFSHLDHYNWFYLGKTVHDTLFSRERHYTSNDCMFCYAKKKRIVCLKFIDYRQFLEFFNLKKKDVPSHIIKHLHQQGEMYVGNSILDDLDPVDGVNDPWFRGGDRAKERYRFAHTSSPEIIIAIPICLRCLNKYKRRADIEQSSKNSSI